MWRVIIFAVFQRCVLLRFLRLQTIYFFICGFAFCIYVLSFALPFIICIAHIFFFSFCVFFRLTFSISPFSVSFAAQHFAFTFCVFRLAFCISRFAFCDFFFFAFVFFFFLLFCGETNKNGGNKRKINKYGEIFFVFAAIFVYTLHVPLNVCCVCVLRFAICVCPLQHAVCLLFFEKNKTMEKTLTNGK